MAVNPQPGLASVVTTGGTAVTAVPANPQGGGIITNPMSKDDQGIATAEPLYVNAVSAATLGGYGTTFALSPGQSWNVIPGQITSTSVNATTSGHRFSVIWW